LGRAELGTSRALFGEVILRTRFVAGPVGIMCAGGIIVLFLSVCCAPRHMAGVAQAPAGGAAHAASHEGTGTVPDTAGVSSKSYDVEEEMPEKTPQKPAQLIENLAPVKPDTVGEQDIATEEAPKQLYSIGYRIQVFASGDRAAAEKIKMSAAAGTGLATYIEYEEGLYKVRAGDFAERKDAAQAMLKLAKTYPGSWIVRTTIRK
ncbi:MAG: SPOR domain-containing protein, partial [Candidatus Krumholzibacteria bacterium]|nr:SPOR domain-containing protein [Candidatus Krumholzibacteria bacterium]